MKANDKIWKVCGDTNHGVGNGGFTNAHTNVDGATTDAQYSKLFVRGIGVPFKPTINSGFPPAFTYVNPVNLQSAALPSSAKTCGAAPTLLLPDQDAIDMMEKVIKDSITYINNITESKWMAKQNVYKLLRYDSNYTTATPILDTFYNAPCPAGIKKIQDIEDSIDAGSYTGAQVLVNLLVPTNAIEANYKNYYNLFLNYMNTGHWHTADSSTLLDIAYKCIFTDGPIVINARVFYNSMYREQYTIFSDDCDGRARNGEGDQKPNIVMEPDTINHFAVEVYPNPSDGTLNLICKECDDNTVVTIYDAIGKVVWKHEISYESGETSIRFLLNPGVYTLIITNSIKQQHETKKLIVK